MSSDQALPFKVSTLRLVLRRQHPDDARMIKEAVDTSLEHLQSSVAWAQLAPFPLPVLAAHLAASAAAFDAGEAWAFSILDRAQTRVLGGAALERAEPALIALVGPDSMETGYWLRPLTAPYGQRQRCGCSTLVSILSDLVRRVSETAKTAAANTNRIQERSCVLSSWAR